MWLVLALIPAAVYLTLFVPEWGMLPWNRGSAGDPVVARTRRRGILAALSAGAVVALPIELVVKGLAAWTQVDPKATETGVASSIAVMLFLFAPLEEASKVLTLFPFRTRHLEDGEDGVVLGTAVATGFACVEVAWYLRGKSLGGLEGAIVLTRIGLATLAR